ncbi:MAG: hypothetical protein [Bacteriophage sp.]|nr:MAG: hypothetical protein [Bacteriophage sp.]
MIDNNERLTYLDTRHTNQALKRIITSTISNYLDIKRKNNNTFMSKELLESRYRAIRNALFLKYAGIEFEMTPFVMNYNDRKLPRKI